MTGTSTDDHVALGRLLSRYADIVNRRSWYELSELFAESAVIHLDLVDRPPIDLHGPAELGEFVGAAVERFAFFEFVVLNSHVEVLEEDPDRAIGRVFMSEIRRDTGTLEWSSIYGVYHDRYLRSPSGWRFERRRYQTLTRTDGEVFEFPHHGARSMLTGRIGWALGAVLSAVVVAAGCVDAEPDADASVSAGAKVTVAGDSISIGLGTQLRTAVGEDVEVKVIGVEGSGLARPDSFDWPARLAELARDFPPDVLVFSLSSNDAQDLVDRDGDVVAPLADADEWDHEYSERLARSFDAFEDTDTTVRWVGHVRTAEDRVGLRNRHIQDLATQVAEGRDWVEVLDLAEILGSGDAVADGCLRSDGLHLDVECLDRAAARLAESSPVG